ncbi:hypothetical protein ACFOKJ_05355 [Vogesella amnigena]|uniref:DegT/DnrJ/EryC1/StrS aminotransferase n=1 Tax=Vogesella amnigena TaxID=1507449 RepID=A0ABV7TS45_9NEIS
MQVIGGEYWLVPSVEQAAELAAEQAGSQPDYLSQVLGPAEYFATGRDALFAVLQALPQPTVWLPDLVCLSLVTACRQAGKQVCSYAVGADLLPRDIPLTMDAANAVIVVIHYFGVYNPLLPAWAGQRGLTVLSDVTHLLFDAAALQACNQASDYVFASLRKSGPWPDGGLLASRRQALPQADLPGRLDFVALRAAGLLLRGLSASQGFADNENLAWLREAESLLDRAPAGAHACSYLSRQLLAGWAPQQQLAPMAVNFQTLRQGLPASCQLLNAAASYPLHALCAFASSAQRDQVRSRLAAAGCFAPIHWPVAGLPVVNTLASCILSLPCDARYRTEDMQRILSVIQDETR